MLCHRGADIRLCIDADNNINGQKQRVAIARAVISKPKIILADEPTGALDSKTSEEVMKVLSELNSTGITTILVTHEQSVADITKRIINLKDGKIESSSINGSF